MSMTIEISPELEERLRKQAGKLGVEADLYARHMLEDQLRENEQRDSAARLSAEESALLEEINQGLSHTDWRRYRELIARRQAETLTEEEQQELIGFSDRIEQLNARRMELLVKLSRLKNIPLELLMSQLGHETATESGLT